MIRSLPEVIAVSPDWGSDPQSRLLANLLGANMSAAGLGTAATRSALLELMLTQILRRWLERNGAAD